MITQLTGSGYGGRRYGSFAGREEVVVVVPPAAAVVTGGASFWSSYEAHAAEKTRAKKKRKKLAEAAEALQDKIDRELAIELRKDADERDRLEELRRLTKLAEAHAQTIRQTLSDGAIAALDRAINHGHYAAMEALERHLRRAKEEEDFLLQAFKILMEDD